MNQISKKISANWKFVLGIAIGVGLMSLALNVAIYDAIDWLCQMNFEKCSENPLADCRYACVVNQIDKDSLKWLTLASLPFFAIALILGIMHRDAKRD